MLLLLSSSGQTSVICCPPPFAPASASFCKPSKAQKYFHLLHTLHLQCTSIGSGGGGERSLQQDQGEPELSHTSRLRQVAILFFGREQEQERRARYIALLRSSEGAGLRGDERLLLRENDQKVQQGCRCAMTTRATYTAVYNAPTDIHNE